MLEDAWQAFAQPAEDLSGSPRFPEGHKAFLKLVAQREGFEGAAFSLVRNDGVVWLLCALFLHQHLRTFAREGGTNLSNTVRPCQNGQDFMEFLLELPFLRTARD